MRQWQTGKVRHQRNRGLTQPFSTAVLSCALALGCGSDKKQSSAAAGSNAAPEIEAVEDRNAVVGQELSITLRGSDADGDALSFGFSSDLGDLRGRASVEPAGADDTVAVFRYTPVVSDVGIHAFDFSVSDAVDSATVSANIDVRALATGSGAPVFRRPLGSGTTLDLASNDCVDVAIEIEDPDSPGVTLSADPLEGAELVQDSGLTASWQWCPSAAQIEADDYYPVRFHADDGENPIVTKDFLVVLRRQLKANCPGAAPVIEHSPADQSTLQDIVLTARVTDDLGIKFTPLVLYALSDPGDPPDLAQLTQVTMQAQSGNSQDGSWSATVPNPVANAAAGAQATLYYLISVRDNDDADGDCDHRTDSPQAGTHSLVVTNPGQGTEGAEPCEPCSADAQCGTDGDSCVFIGTSSESFCAQGCGGSGECPSGYSCSDSDVTSVDGVKSRQCLPDSAVCGEPPPPTCEDDDFEDNDSLAQVATRTPLGPGSYPAVSCSGAGSDDEDWFPIELTQEGTILASIDGGDATDLDLTLVDSAGSVIARSESLGSDELLQSGCLPAGRYYLRVFAFGSGQNDYALEWLATPQSCTPPQCSDDAEEDDDDAASARDVDLDLGAYVSDTNAICSMDEDWYGFILFQGETLRATLTFEQLSDTEDLDVLLYQDTTLLTPCTEQDVSGCSDNGQSSTSNEVFEHTAVADDIYYLVVRGYDGSENLYDICIGRNALDCPAP